MYQAFANSKGYEEVMMQQKDEYIFKHYLIMKI